MGKGLVRSRAQRNPAYFKLTHCPPPDAPPRGHTPLCPLTAPSPVIPAPAGIQFLRALRAFPVLSLSKERETKSTLLPPAELVTVTMFKPRDRYVPVTPPDPE